MDLTPVRTMSPAAKAGSAQAAKIKTQEAKDRFHSKFAPNSNLLFLRQQIPPTSAYPGGIACDHGQIAISMVRNIKQHIKNQGLREDFQ